jgi:formiminotetrahydrofolate cyclodeaminase
MTPLYAGRALTQPERDDLGAFLLQASGRPAPGGRAVAAFAAAIAALVLLALSRLSRLTKGSTRAALLARARASRPHGDLR